MSNTKIFSVTYSNQDGFFLFNRTIVPKNSGEYCLISIDESNRSTPVLCLPPPPPINTFTNIGPIILGPTLSQDINSTEIVTSGQSIPNSAISIQLFQVENKPSLVKKASAFSLPKYSIISDRNGDFSFNLPTQYSSQYRYYASVTTKDMQFSAKSNTLWYQNQSQTWPNLFILYLTAVIIIIIILLTKKYKTSWTNFHHYPALRAHYWPRSLY